jgi:O-antigen ligase
MKKFFFPKFNTEILIAIFLIIIFSLFILLNFLAGFNLLIYFVIALLSLIASFLFPRSAVFSILFLTIVFQEFFSLQSIVVSEAEYKFYLLDVLFLPVLLSVVFSVLMGKIKITLRKPDFFAVCFLLLSFFYFLFSLLLENSVIALSFSSFKNYFFYPLFYFVVLFLFNKKEDFKNLFYFFLSASLIVLFFLFTSMINGQGLWTEYTPLSTTGTRFLSFSHGFYLSIILFPVLILNIIKENKKFNFYYLLMALFSLGIMACLMRHLWLAIFLAIVFLYIFLFKKEEKFFLKFVFLKYLTFLCVILSIFFAIIFMSPKTLKDNKIINWQSSVIERVSSLFYKDDSSVSWRKSVWQEGFSELKNHYFFGLGFGKEITVNMENERTSVEVRNVHNSFLALFIQMGLFGLLLFFLWIFSVFKRVFKKEENINLGKIIKFSVLSIFVMQVMAFMFQPYLEINSLNLFFWINLGLARRYYEGFIS